MDYLLLFAAIVFLSMVASPLLVMAWQRLQRRKQQRREEAHRIARLDAVARSARRSQAELERKRLSVGWSFDRRRWWE